MSAEMSGDEIRLGSEKHVDREEREVFWDNMGLGGEGECTANEDDMTEDWRESKDDLYMFVNTFSCLIIH